MKGVYRTKSGTFQSRIRLNGKQHSLGTFPTKAEAAAAYQEAVAEKEAGTLQAYLDSKAPKVCID